LNPFPRLPAENALFLGVASYARDSETSEGQRKTKFVAGRAQVYSPVSTYLGEHFANLGEKLVYFSQFGIQNNKYLISVKM
jgi:hypothetical protein